MALWRCDEDQRLYAVDNNAPEKDLIPDLPSRVRCTPAAQSRGRGSASVVLARPLRSIPALNAAARVEDLPDGKKIVAVPLSRKPWSRIAKYLLPIRDERKLELDRLSSEMIQLFDGQRTIEEIIDLHMTRWKLSFFEARGMVLDFVKRLVARNAVVLLMPDDGANAPVTSEADARRLSLLPGQEQ